MKDVNVTMLRQNLPEYLAQVEAGETIRVTVHGRTIAEITQPSAVGADAAAARAPARQPVALRSAAGAGTVLRRLGRKRMIVLDTHILIWWLCSPSNLSARAKRAIKEAASDNAVFVSAISVFEIVTLVRRGRLQFSVPVDAWLADVRMLPELRIAPLTVEVAQVAGGFAEDMPGDPADRIIAATAIALSAALITADTRLRSYKGLKTAW